MLIVICNLAVAQDDKETTSNRYTLKFETGHQRVGFPFRKPFANPYHFYVGIGAERVWKSKTKHSTYQTLDLGYFQNQSSGSGYHVLSNYGYRYFVSKSISVSGEAGLGFIHLFRPNAVYEMKDNGTYEQIRDWGKIHPSVDFNLQFGYQPNQLSLFIEYNIVSEFLYNDDAIFYPQTFFSLGLRYKIQ